MQVYIVMYDYQHSSFVHKVFTNKDDAKRCADRKNDEQKNKDPYRETINYFHIDGPFEVE